MHRLASAFVLLTAYACAGTQQPQQQPTAPAAKPGLELTLERLLNEPRSLMPKLPQVQWIPGGQSFSIIRKNKEGVEEVYAHNASADKESMLFTAPGLCKALGSLGIKLPKQDRIPGPFTWFDAQTLRLATPRGILHWNIKKEKAKVALPFVKGMGAKAATSSDDKLAFIQNEQLHVRHGGGKPMQLTADGAKEDMVYGGGAHRREFGIKDGLWWGPQGRMLAFYREDMRPIRPYPYVDHTSMPPKTVHGRYPMAGDPHSLVQVGVHDSQTGAVYYLEQGKEKDVYWTNVTFGPKGQKIYVALVNRDQNHMELWRFNAYSGKREAMLFSEDDEQWVEPEHGPMFLPSGEGFLWFSFRDGYRHLYHYDMKGKLQRQATGGGYDIHAFLGFSNDGQKAFVLGSGKDPLQMHLWEIDPKAKVTGACTEQITQARGRHDCQISPDSMFILDRHSSMETPPRLSLLDRRGKENWAEQSSNPIQSLGKQEFFQVPIHESANDLVKDFFATDFTVEPRSKPKLLGHIILPTDFDPKKKYPVLHYVYGGPHSQLVTDTWLGGASLWLYYMATQGFIVSRLDNRGTDNRGIEFLQSIHRQCGKLETADQVRAIEHLKSLPYVDADRIGVHGWSYGGYMTLNLMLRTDHFACGASGAPPTTWAQYETGYTERYMDTPQQNPEGYKNASVLPLAKNLKGRLLVIHGTADDTVMWSHSMAFVDRCIDAGVLVDYMPYPMQLHGMRGKDRQDLYRRLTRFFKEQLQD